MTARARHNNIVFCNYINRAVIYYTDTPQRGGMLEENSEAAGL